MKKLIVTLSLILCMAMTMMAQTANRDKSVYLEFLGPSNLIGLSYDARFKNDNHWGYRVGIGYAYGMVDFLSFYEQKSHAFAIPAEINYLVGKSKHRLELGLGANVGLYRSSRHIMGDKYSASSFGYFFYGDVGYRLTAKSGFQFRCGLMPTFNFGGSDGVGHDPFIFPYLSFGYAF